MICEDYTYFDNARGQEGVIRLHGGQWVGDECVFEFTVPLRGLAGVVRADWRQSEPMFELTDGAVDDPETKTVLEKVVMLLPGFHTGAFDGVTADDLEALYAAEYHAGQSYAVSSPFEQQRKGVLADLTIELTRPEKVLVAGCSAGECIRQLRARGVDAWGFDICPEVEKIAYPEAQGFVRRGSVTRIPFEAGDGFDTLTAFDVFEHVPEVSLPAMVEEFRRLGLRHLVVLTAYCEYGYPGHVTLRPLRWWDNVFAPHFTRVPNHELPNAWPVVEPGSADPTKLLRVYSRNG